MKLKPGLLQILLLSILLPFSCFAQVVPPPDKPREPENLDADVAGKVEIATFAGGCFWCTEAYFERLQGVQRVVSGYCGGKENNPTYNNVSTGKTGHAESVQITFDPQQISYADLLKVHFATHDPTTLNRQGPDVGKQYRSVVFYHSPQQKKQAENYLAQLSKSGKYKDKIVTQLVPYTQFWPAETYHQNYYAKNPKDPYVVSVARPKVLKFEKEFASRMKKTGKK
ncbi:peptide-methionine (S)-S-oxide reductase MsrA [Adhaeribacter sp. BT258]|uniref:Peptide methionine sulfoxide reductase MsrA n=1 Tax=Adhaeribacter terrigena TaxID=2793070 RepID=A0ABS1C124_9BACT|nr:peptide-methionine (S)-S-oxide reductase MsrA [Adhaeribacter terrigena]MBK0403035.1 peptide-methionine (S)-S-oxide reductase MsrA [Adhaeribacter terrigena]